MFTVKLVTVFDKDSRQQIRLLAGSEIAYEVENYKRDDFKKSVRKLLGEGDNFTYIGLDIPDTERKEVCSMMYLRLFDNGDWKRYLLQDGWVYIMHNGKTIDKFEFINT
jgi:hypothetical protein